MPDQPSEIATSAHDAAIRLPYSGDPALSIVLVTFGTGEVVLDALRSVVTHTDVGTTPYEHRTVGTVKRPCHFVEMRKKLRPITSSLGTVAA